MESSQKDPVPLAIANISFGDVFWSWVPLARGYLGKSLGEEFITLLPTEVLFSLEKSLVEKWSHCCARTMALEMGIARLSRELQGETSKARYHDFIQKKLSSPQALRIFFTEYRELGRLVGTFLLHWVEQTTEFFHRLEKDLPLMEKTFNAGKPLGIPQKLSTDLGDHHFGGRSVYSVTFKNGLSLFYKPKNLNSAKAYNTLVSELNSLGLSPTLKSYHVLAQGDYGWEEKVEYAPCKTEEEAALFFQRTGMLLCLAYLLQGNDAHYQNFIASGEHPVLIDLETLFHTDLRKSNPSEEAVKRFEHSVLTTGMLPMHIPGERGMAGIDLSALGCSEGQIYPFKTTRWEEINTDRMHLVTHFKSVDLESSMHRVKLGEKTMPASAQVENMVKGFETLHLFIRQNRHLLLHNESALWLLIQAPVRIVLRLTFFYSRLLNHLFDPKVLLHPSKTQEVLHALEDSLEIDPELHAQIVAEETKALLQGDIPCFHTLPSQQDLYCQHRVVSPNAFTEPASSAVIERLRKLDEKDCQFQVTLIRQAFFARKMKPHDEVPLLRKESVLSQSAVSDVELLSHAESIASDILKHAFRNEDGSLGWIALEPDPGMILFQLKVLSDSLYTGNGGIALFFAALYKATQKQQWKIEALNALKRLRKIVHSDSKKWILPTYGIGGMSGIGGILYVLHYVGKLLDEPALAYDIRLLLDCVEKRHIQNDKSYDILTGSAGFLLTLLSIYSHTRDTQALSLAKICGDHLCQSIRKMDGGAIAWGSDIQPTLGFSHGTSGIAFALLKLSEHLKDANLLSVVKGAHIYERKFFSSEHGTWADLRENPPHYSAIWCHGASGIGLARLASIPLLKDQQVQRDVELAIKTTQKDLSTQNCHLCCGVFGRLEFLIEASRKLTQPNLEQQVRQTMREFFPEKEIDNTEIALNTLFDKFYCPGFMTGMAGIGYTLLRLQDQKHALPQVLLLQ